MSVLTAFADYQRDVVNADQAQVDIARSRRDTILDAFRAETDVTEAFCSGSLRRRTQLRPIHDVDLVVVYRGEDWPGWGTPGTSSADAIAHVQKRVNTLLGATSGSRAHLVRYARASGRGRSVKCFIDSTDAEAGFTVDVMPALRNDDGTLLLPSQTDQRWSTANPEYLIAEVRDRQAAWNKFHRTVRLLKLWARQRVPTPVKSLVVEVLAFHHLPTNDDFNVPEALRRFFTAAAAAVTIDVEDPAGYCGKIQPDLDDVVLRTHLALAADHAQRALVAAGNGDQDTAVSHWREILGPSFAPDYDEDASPVGSTSSGATTPRPVRDAPQG